CLDAARSMRRYSAAHRGISCCLLAAFFNQLCLVFCAHVSACQNFLEVAIAIVSLLGALPHCRAWRYHFATRRLWHDAQAVYGVFAEAHAVIYIDGNLYVLPVVDKG